MSISPSFFPCEKLICDFFLFLSQISHNFTLETRRKSLKKKFVPGEKGLKKKKKFSHRRFLIAVFFGGEQFLLNVKPFSYRPQST
jgi:hypothetical protein